jgi:hypothetical protein
MADVPLWGEWCYQQQRNTQWTQNNSELELRHTRGEEVMERARGSKTAKSLSQHVVQLKKLFTF